MTPRIVLPYCGSPERPSARTRYRLPDTKSGLLRRGLDAVRLRELDVDPVRDLGAVADVGERMAVLVDVDGHGRGLLQGRSAGIAGRKWLLAVLDAEIRELRQRLDGLVECPVLVH